MNLPLLDSKDQRGIDIKTVKRMVDTFMENGFTYFDTAYSYHQGDSEVAFREAVSKRYPRLSYTITDKLSLFMIQDEKELEGFFEGQLDRLGVEYIDYYWLNGLNSQNYRQAEEMHAFDFLKQKKAKGKIRHIGLSFNDKAEILEQVLTAHPEIEYVQIKLNYLDWNNPAVEYRLCYEVAVKHRKPVIVTEPTRCGSLINITDGAKRIFKEHNPNLSIESWAIRFAASPDNVMMVVSNMSNEEQMQDNISYMKNFKRLDKSEQETVKKAAEIIRSYPSTVDVKKRHFNICD